MAITVAGLMLVSGARGQPANAPPPSFTGSAAAEGAGVTVTVPGAPLTDTLVDSNGPDAQVASSSISSGTGYAGFPSPGALVQSAPGVITGLLGQGAAGLPPIKLPTLPAYPLQVNADQQTPTAALGSGPYQLTAHSAGYDADASATGGLETSLLGNASLLSATANLTATADQVISTATSDAQVVSIGPLTIGRIKTTATMTLLAGGQPQAGQSLEISGLRIGGIAISLNDKGLDVAGSVTIPLPINSTLQSILKGSGLSVAILPARQIQDGVIAPAVQITDQFNAAALSAAKGTMTITIGGATASLSGAAPAAAAPPINAVVPTQTTPETSAGGTVSPPGLGASPAVTPTETPGTTPTATQSPTQQASGAVTTAVAKTFDIRDLYLLFALLAVAAWVAGQLIRILGVRDRWTSIGG